MAIIDVIKSGASKLFSKKDPEVEVEKELGDEYLATKKKIYQSELKKAALAATKIKAKQEAYSKSGLDKLKEVNAKYSKTPSFMSGLAKKIAANRERTLKNLKRTAEMRRIAMEEREKRMKMNQSRVMQMQRYRPMGSQLKNKPKFDQRPRGSLY